MMPMDCMAEGVSMRPPSRIKAMGVSSKKDRIVISENRLMLSREPCAHRGSQSNLKGGPSRVKVEGIDMTLGCMLTR